VRRRLASSTMSDFPWDVVFELSSRTVPVPDPTESESLFSSRVSCSDNSGLVSRFLPGVIDDKIMQFHDQIA